MWIEAQSSYRQTYQEHVDGIPKRRALRLHCRLYPIQKFKFISRFDVFIGVDPGVEQSPFHESILCGIENDSDMYSRNVFRFFPILFMNLFGIGRDFFHKSSCRFQEFKRGSSYNAFVSKINNCFLQKEKKISSLGFEIKNSQHWG